MEAARRALDRSRPGDLVVLCVDYAGEVWKELESRRSLAMGHPPSGDGKLEVPSADPELVQFGIGL